MSTHVEGRPGHVIVSLGDEGGAERLEKYYRQVKCDGLPVYSIVLHGSQVGQVGKDQQPLGDLAAEALHVKEVLGHLGGDSELTIIGHGSPKGTTFQFDQKTTGTGLSGPLTVGNRTKHFAEVIELISANLDRSHFSQEAPLQIRILSCYSARGGIDALAAKTQRCFFLVHGIPTRIRAYEDVVYIDNDRIYTMPDVEFEETSHPTMNLIPEERKQTLVAETKPHLFSMRDGIQFDRREGIDQPVGPLEMGVELQTPARRATEKTARLHQILKKIEEKNPETASSIQEIKQAIQEYYAYQCKNGLNTAEAETVVDQLEMALSQHLQGEKLDVTNVLNTLEIIQSGGLLEGEERALKQGYPGSFRVSEYQKASMTKRTTFAEKMKAELKRMSTTL